MNALHKFLLSLPSEINICFQCFFITTLILFLQHVHNGNIVSPTPNLQDCNFFVFGSLHVLFLLIKLQHLFFIYYRSLFYFSSFFYALTLISSLLRPGQSRQLKFKRSEQKHIAFQLLFHFITFLSCLFVFLLVLKSELLSTFIGKLCGYTVCYIF